MTKHLSAIAALAASLTFSVPSFKGTVYNDRGRPVKPLTRRVGTTDREFAKKHSIGMVRVSTDNEEILGFLIRKDLAGVRVAHAVHERSQYGQPRRLRWVMDDVPFFNIRDISILT